MSSAGFGVGCRFQDLPFHRSASVTLRPSASRSLPTAVHALAEEQETDSIRPPGTVLSGELATCQAGAAAGVAATTAVEEQVSAPATKPTTASISTLR